MYGYNGTMKIKPGHLDDVVRILLDGLELNRATGCLLYAVSTAADKPDTIFINEVWESKEHHDASLETPEVKASIAAAMPMLTGEFTGQELAVAGGLGVENPR